MTLQRLTLALAGAAVAAAAGLALRDGAAADAKVPAVLRAQAIELVDARGRVRAQLNVERSGEVVLRLRDRTGAIRVKLGAGDDGSGLVLMNETSQPGVHALATRSGTSLALQRDEQRRVVTP
jgi:hypothetical protein